MNYLAHIHLSGDDSEVLLGNFMADAVKGKRYEDYPTGVRQGILLHRFIDDFTDTHPIVEESKARLRPTLRKYAGVAVDVFYDHFLANTWSDYAASELHPFVQKTYRFLEEQQHRMPDKIQYMLTYMVRQDWLTNYRHIEGIDRALTGLSQRTKFASGMEHAALELEKHYDAFAQEFEAFFPELVRESADYLRQLQSAEK